MRMEGVVRVELRASRVDEGGHEDIEPVHDG